MTRPSLWFLGFVGLLVCGLIAWSVVDLVDGDSAGEDVGVTVEDVLEDTDDYVAETVTISGRVRRLERGAYVVGRNPEEPLLLLTTAHTRNEAPVGDIARIVGVVRRFDREVLREFRGPFDARLGADYLNEYEGQPVVVVQGFERAAAEEG